MDINKQTSSTHRPAQETREVLTEALLRTRSRVRAFNKSLGEVEPKRAERRADQIDISPRTAILNELREAEPEQIQKLKRLYESGELNDPKRMLQAAGRILGAE